MQIVIDITNESLANKIVQILEVFKKDGVSFKKIKHNGPEKKTTEDNTYDVAYEKSFQYKLDRAEFEEMKENL